MYIIKNKVSVSHARVHPTASCVDCTNACSRSNNSLNLTAARSGQMIASAIVRRAAAASATNATMASAAIVLD